MSAPAARQRRRRGSPLTEPSSRHPSRSAGIRTARRASSTSPRASSSSATPRRAGASGLRSVSSASSSAVSATACRSSRATSGSAPSSCTRGWWPGSSMRSPSARVGRRPRSASPSRRHGRDSAPTSCAQRSLGRDGATSNSSPNRWLPPVITRTRRRWLKAHCWLSTTWAAARSMPSSSARSDTAS